MAKLAENRYGKSRVRLVRVKRGKDGHELSEWTVQILLQGDFESCFTEGDNSKILPTDTMKNTVYSLAKSTAASCVEDFAKEIIEFFLNRNPQISAAEVNVSEVGWDHVRVGGAAHPTTFVQSGSENQTTHVRHQRGDKYSVVSGIDNLVILKTADSGFEGYIKDSLTTLPETKDRLFGTALRADWTYNTSSLPFASLRTKIRELLLTAFAEHKSKSVQHTLHDMAERVLGAVPEVREIVLVMPNKHCLLVDLSRFGQDNPNEIFVPTDEPHGYIEARICRE
ncbi:MAG TPA: urate oxidase [Candidatus Dormibacteraeota bacterium]|jgi:urate oxidase|nr:urate oxidase [Candidatus Dormibacteraeota bacterium]